MARKSSDASYRNYTARVHLNAINNTHCIVPSGRYVFLSMPYACVCARTTTRLQWAPNWACSFSSSASQLLTVLLSFVLFSKRRLHLLFDARPNEICRLFCHPFELYTFADSSESMVSKYNFAILPCLISRNLILILTSP